VLCEGGGWRGAVSERVLLRTGGRASRGRRDLAATHHGLVVTVLACELLDASGRVEAQFSQGKKDQSAPRGPNALAADVILGC
jgi:hypothetical protein